MRPYLIQYLTNKYGNQPIEFPRKDRFGSLLPQLTRKPNPGDNQFEHYGKSNLEVVLPFNEGRNVLYHNFIPAPAMLMFEGIILREFLAGFHDFMNQAYSCRVGPAESVNVFIDLNQLDPSCTDMLLKERQRYVSGLRLNKWREKKKRQLDDVIVRSENL